MHGIILYMIFASTISFAARTTAWSPSQEKLKISVYYETLCWDSINFIKNQLYPVYNTELSAFLTLEFVPYGNARTTALPNGTYEFTCQHGAAECFGNKMHSCAANHLDVEVAAAFINCTMSQSNPPESGKFCSDELKISYEPIEICTNSKSGTLLLVKNGIRTSSLNPPLDWVPWITYNDVFNQEDWDSSQSNLLSVVCKHLKGAKPRQCNEDAEREDRLKISVYYEVLCPDSIRFINTQLYPLYRKIAKYISLDLVPYGAAQTMVTPNGTYNFECQHGEAECYGNKINACAINQLQPAVSAAFVNCTMSQIYPPQAGPYCADILQIPYSPIQSCAESQTGNKLLAHNGDRTNDLSPSMYWVPWITYNDVFYPEDLDQSQISLFPVVCKHLRGSKPSECNKVARSI